MSLRSKFRQLARVIADPRWWPFYLQRRVMSASVRERAAGWIARTMRPASGPALAGEDAQTARRTAELADAGISHFGALLTREQASELEAWFLAHEVHDPYRSAHDRYLPTSDQRHPHSHVAHHDPRDVVLAPHLLELVNRPEILDTVAARLGCKPTLGYLAAWWSYPTPLGAQQAENFHRDVDDWRFLKLFIYLTDVGADNGPHIYVAHSRASERLREIRRFDDGEVVEAFGRDNVLELTARAGEGFLEDTFGIHKGQPVRAGRRLMFQAVYSMFPLPYGPKAAVATRAELAPACAARVDPWTNRLYVTPA